MANSYHQVYIQTVFAVKYRNASLQTPWREDLFKIIGNLTNETGCKSYIVNGTEDHLHSLFSFKPTCSLSQVIQSVKAKSSKWINESRLSRHRFEWQGGFGAFSYSSSEVPLVYNYIKNQEEHHRKLSFREEYLKFLKDFKIDYNEQYLFHEPE